MSPSSTPNASWADLLSARNLARSVALTGGVALHAINVHIVTTILPSVVADIGGLDYYAWNITLFIVASIVGATLTAKLLAWRGPRAAYWLALGIFCVGVVVCAWAPNMGWMLAGRTVQGLGGGLLTALSYALIRVVFEPPLWSRAMALVSGMWGVATLFGPAVGGLFAQGGHWRWAFWSLLPVAALQALVIGRELTNHLEKNRIAVQVPIFKITLLAGSVVVIAVASLLETTAWKVLGVALGLGLGVAMAQLDQRAKVPLLPTGSYSLNSRMGVLFACMGLLMVGVCIEIFVPYFLQTLHGFTPLMAGYATAAMAGGWSAAALISSGQSGAGADRMVLRGPPVMVMSLLVLAAVLPGTTGWSALLQNTVMVLALTGIGMGVGLGWPHLLTRVLQSAAPGEENLASSAITTVQLYAMAIGAALAGLTANAAGLTVPGGPEGARQAAVWLFVSFALAPALATYLALRIVRSNRSAQVEPLPL